MRTIIGWAVRGKARGVNAVEVVLTCVAFVVLQRFGLIADGPLWLYVVLTVGGGALSALAFQRWGRDCTEPQLHARTFVNVAVTTLIIYAIGWGPMLAIGYLYVATDAIKHSGARAGFASMLWIPLGITGGQVAIALDVAPTFLGQPQVHGLAVLGILAVEYVLHTESLMTRETERAEAEVRQSAQRFHALVRNSSDIVAVVDELGVMRYISEAVERMGYTVEEAREHLVAIHPDDVEAASRAFMEALEHPERVVVVEVRMPHADGHWLWQEVSLTNRCDDPSVEGVVVNFHDVTERRLFEERLAHAAYHDRLTGLANRAGFVQRLEEAVNRSHANGSTLALMFLDLDHFKVINDTYGHNVGDRVLVEVADRLRSCVRAGDLIGRYGGDEFTILIQHAEPMLAEELAERVTAMMRVPFTVGGRELLVTASVGLVVTTATGLADDVLRSADLAMYLAKENGRSRWELFNDGIETGVLEHYRIAAELRHAIEQRQLVTYFQPEIALATGAVVGFEALVRWQHPERGLLLPNSFIPVAEQNDLIHAIDCYVLEQACRELPLLQSTNGHERRFVSVNISPESLSIDGANELLAIVATSGVDPTCLQLEITERTAVASPTSIEAIERLRQQRIHVVIDDFGTGYSSLECLQRLPVDGLKIDRGFVADLDVTPTATAIVHAIVTLGRQLGLRLTAEGVETAAQLGRLRTLGCDSAQGYYFSTPLPASEARATVAKLVVSD